MLPARRLKVPFSQRSSIGELRVRLVIEVRTVGDDDEGPVARDLPQHFLGEEEHRHRLTRALRVPEDSKPPAILFRAATNDSQALDGVVDPQVLVVLRHELYEALWALLEGHEVLHEIEEALGLARTSEHGLQ